MSKAPFSDLKVVELAGVLAGPAAGMFFAELGAEVIKIEPPFVGDVTRSWRLPVEKSESSSVSAYFSTVNWGKKSITVDLKRQNDKFLRFLDVYRPDIILTNFRKGSAEKLGLDYPKLSERFPELIYGQITGYGTDSDRAGFDAVVQAESGFMFLNRESVTDVPAKIPVALMDLLAAHQLKEGILVALYQRLKTGKGALVSASLIESAVSSLANQAASYLKTGNLPAPTGSDHPSICPYGSLFLTSESKYLLLAIGNDPQFERFSLIVGHPEWADDERFSRNSNRVIYKHELKEKIAEELSKKSLAEWLSYFHAAGIPCGAVLDPAEALQVPEISGLILENEIKGLRTAVFHSNTFSSVDRLAPPPELAEHQYLWESMQKS